MKIAAYIWCILSIISLLVFAFTGRAVWATLDTQLGVDAIRFVLLLVFHMGGFLAALAVQEIK